MPAKSYRHICKEKNFLYLNCKNMLKPKVLEIITNFINESDDNFKALRNNLFSYKNIFQYLYSNVFPKIYCSTKKRDFDLKSNFHIIFKTCKDKKKLETSLGKNPESYGTVRNETNMYEQKPTYKRRRLQGGGRETGERARQKTKTEKKRCGREK